MALTNQNLIVSIDDFRGFTAISDNFDSSILASIIIRATDLNCQEVLGTALTEKLTTDFNADTLAGDYLELYDSAKASVKKMVIWQAYVYGLPRFAFKIQNNGISKTGGDLDTNSIDNSDLGILQREARGVLANYENRVKNYLSQNYSNFPELQDSTPEYLRSDLTKSNTDYGISDTPTKYYSDF
jgi:hypothetical protein